MNSILEFQKFTLVLPLLSHLIFITTLNNNSIRPYKCVLHLTYQKTIGAHANIVSVVISLLALSTNSPSKNHYTSSTSEAVPPPTLSQNQAFSLPPGHAVCCFMDGGVGLYDMGTKKWDFLRDLVGKVICFYLSVNIQCCVKVCEPFRIFYISA